MKAKRIIVDMVRKPRTYATPDRAEKTIGIVQASFTLKSTRCSLK